MSYDILWKNVSVKSDTATLRSKIVSSLDSLIKKRKIDWIDCDPMGELGSKETWSKKMVETTTFADRVFIYLASEYLSREFIIIPVFAPQNGGSDRVHIKPFHSTAKYDPFYFLYFSDARFACPHYQSIRPIISDNSVPPPNILSQTNTMPPPIIRQTLGSIPDDIADIAEPPHSSSGQKPKSTSASSISVIESSVVKSKSRQHLYLSQDNILSPSKKRRKINKN